MSIRLRSFLAAGAIAVAVLPLAWLRPSAHTRAAGPVAAASHPALMAEAPLNPRSFSSEPPLGDPERLTLLRAGDFAALLESTLDIEDADEQARWFATCARLAPPRLLAEHALRLPAGPQRESLLAAALDRWVLDAPIQAGEWATAHLEDDHALDFALERIVEHTDTLLRPTAAALAWVDLIHDPALHFRALQTVVREWANLDPAAALRFAETTPGLSFNERASLLALLIPPVTET